MGTALQAAVTYRFGRFEVHPAQGTLLRSGEQVRLKGQPFQILCLLLERPGKIVSREELRQALWAQDSYVEFDGSLNAALKRLRSALGDPAENPIFVETVPKRGYRFIAPVERVPGAETPARPVAVSALVENKSESGPRRLSKRWIGKGWIAVAAAILVAITLGVAYVGYERTRHVLPTASAEPVRSVAVLPLTNLSADPQQEYFSDGLTDELITELAKISGLRVISRTSITGYKGTVKPSSEIGRELHVDAIVEGTVERIGDRVRIRAQLIRTATDEHLWAESYDRDVKDLLQLEGEVARDIARQVGHLTAEQRSGRLPTGAGFPTAPRRVPNRTASFTVQ